MLIQMFMGVGIMSLVSYSLFLVQTQVQNYVLKEERRSHFEEMFWEFEYRLEQDCTAVLSDVPYDVPLPPSAELSDLTGDVKLAMGASSKGYSVSRIFLNHIKVYDRWSNHHIVLEVDARSKGETHDSIRKRVDLIAKKRDHSHQIAECSLLKHHEAVNGLFGDSVGFKVYEMTEGLNAFMYRKFWNDLPTELYTWPTPWNELAQYEE